MQRRQEGTAGEWGGQNPRLEGSWVGESEGWRKGQPLPGLRGEGCPGKGTGEEEVGTSGNGDKLRAVQAKLGHPRDTRGHVLEDGAGSGGPRWDGEQESLWAGLASTGGNILGAPHPLVLLQPAPPVLTPPQQGLHTSLPSVAHLPPVPNYLSFFPWTQVDLCPRPLQGGDNPGLWLTAVLGGHWR